MNAELCMNQLVAEVGYAPLSRTMVCELGVTMSDKSPQKANSKKVGKTLKEKRAAKKMKKADKSSSPHILPTGH
jgi:hypothetical protein